MDVVWGETAGVDGQLWLLCPILFILQVIRKNPLEIINTMLSYVDFYKSNIPFLDISYIN